MPKSISLWFFCVCLALGLSAQASQDQCYKTEIDPSTRRVYKNIKQYQADWTELMEQEPPHPGYARLIKGYGVYREAMATQKKGFKDDKVAHCFMGCLIAGLVDVKTGTYAAWYKEREDIEDCKRRTHFEWEDIVATLKGVQIAANNPKSDDFSSLCRKSCR